MKEINDILNEEINPTLKKLREERSAYLEFQKIQRELEHLTKLYLAWKYVCAEEVRAVSLTKGCIILLHYRQVLNLKKSWRR